ncbi:ribulose-phosphate 3-epimerase [Brevibacillus massiliensis]|uniref:ribulose-phosphate 3-epimerase n=1 Tax=Brevibacillus massiliensis TaxID=1118054 RepID=UPI0003194BED|nr:ribulose-phosphate 3-epimerase [Brevibacillus massiliensis]
MPTISASILAGNHANLAADVIELEQGGADWIHVDIMDGHYVNNLTFGPKTVEDLRKVTSLPIDVHLEMYRPELVIDSFISAGADMITIQFESCTHPIRTIEQVKARNCQVSMAFAPTTSFDQIGSLIRDVDQVNIMTVEPGFGGQPFRKDVLPKIKLASEIIASEKLHTIVAVDGGVNIQNIPDILRNGGHNLIIGTMLFVNDNIKENVEKTKGLFCMTKTTKEMI